MSMDKDVSVYFLGPARELLRGSADADSNEIKAVTEIDSGSEWNRLCGYKSTIADCSAIAVSEAMTRMREIDAERTYPPGFIPVGEAEPIIDRDEVWVH